MKNLQCAWQLLLHSANPWANHTLRTLPPSLSGRYAQDHDDGIWATVEALLQQVPGEVEEQNFAREIATLPMRMGGLELRSATRCAAAAYWASWADALAMISQRNRGVANLVVRTMEGALPCPQGGCLAEVLDASTRLDREGFWWRPSWQELRDGKRPPENTGEPGEWQHGWQYWASSVSDSCFRKTTMLSVRSAASRAHLRSHSGLNAGAALAFASTAPEYVIPTHFFRVLLLERLQLPLPVDEVVCSGCHAPLDPLGRHRAACARTGRLKKRATPIERMLVRVRREGGARVRHNACSLKTSLVSEGLSWPSASH